ncbi:PWWP domain [Macleaya cordata]|uniref:PWWP domain n=1 Tax=Macleaya cordata TaxID=56857 RepID=A0A200PLX7_MACCD|nr:PWWP domain [Macleaya cordata]
MMSVTRNDRELERKSNVLANFPLFEIDSGPEETEVSSDMLGKTRIDDLMESQVVDSMSSDKDNVFDFEHIEPKKMRSEEARFSSKVDSREIDRNMESIISEIKAEEVGRSDCSKISSGEMKGDIEMMEKPTVLDFNSAYFMVDEGNSDRMSEAFGSEAENAVSYEPGDMVWRKVKSHPWWPGQIFSEAFASSSVYRTKREGHVLVAFFGDSSYGWFDPAELIPFEPHYFDKSQQTNSRTFMRAVEKAVDEARMRAALGLVYCCRNPFNFRPANIRGYFTVNVGDYEGRIYSVKEIKKARDNFEPGEALSFVQQLSMNPRNIEQKGIDWVKNVAMFLALRKVTYEEFDETYAQAFGVQPVRSVSNATGVLDQAAKVPSRAPLSGPFMIAGALGERKSFTKSSKVKDQLKKDKYLLKRRDKLNEHKAQHFSPSHVGFDVAYSSASKIQGGPEHRKLLGYKDMNVSYEMSGKVMAVGDVGPTSADVDGSSVLRKLEVASVRDSFDQHLQLENKAVVGLKQEGSQVWEFGDDRSILEPVGTSALLVDAKLSDGVLGTTSDRVAKKAKVVKRLENLNSKKSIIGEKKKKKKKKLGLGAFQDHSNKPLRTEKDGESLRKSTGKSIGIGLVPGESSQLDPQRKSDGASSTFLSNFMQPLPKVDFANIKVELLQLVDDLLALALDPFHGVERNSPAISLVLVPVSEAETSSLSDSKSPASAGPSKIPYDENAMNPPQKLAKLLARRDDPTKSGRKRSLSERLEEKSTKKLKKLNELKSLTTEKKAGTQKTPEPKKGERKEAGTGVTVLLKPTKLDTVKKKPDPTMLVLMFPPRTTLPSISELKARFARFGPLDYSALRVNYQLKDVLVPAPEVPPESAKRRPDEAFDEVPPMRQIGLMEQSPQQQPSVQLKSCLKKPSGEEMAGSACMGGGVSRKNDPHVNHGTAGHNFTMGPHIHYDQLDEQRKTNNYTMTTTTINKVDISNQMLSLMLRCSDIVGDVNSSLGYVTYHPL